MILVRCIVCLLLSAWAASAADRITILYDAFGRPSQLKKDWGFAALVEYGGKRILFDTGNNAEIYAHNVQTLGVDLRKLDFAVISHRHGDHAAGVPYLLQVNPKVKIYWPDFGGFVPAAWFRRGVESLPAEMRYFGGAPPEKVPAGSYWPRANLILVDQRLEVAPGVTIVRTVSRNPGTMEMPELTLSLRTGEGQVLVHGCSHPGVEEILAEAVKVEPRVRLIVGGLHQVTTPDADIQKLATALRDKWKVARIAPGHCTGEPMFALLQKLFGDRYVYAGLGSVIEIP